MRIRLFLLTWACATATAGLSGALLPGSVIAAEEKTPAAAQAEQKQALQAAQGYVGDWRGVGQTKRGSAEGSWLEESAWAWSFKKDSAALTFTAPKGKFFQQGSLTPGDEEGQVKLICRNTEGEPVAEFAGKLEESGDMVLLAKEAAADAPARISIRTVAGGDRMLVLLERRLGDTDRYLRIAEIGYTRRGSNFGQAGVTRECVVTGGAGTIAVTYNGQTYYVCCTGCRDFFNDDPEGVLADYRAKKEEERKAKENNP